MHPPAPDRRRLPTRTPVLVAALALALTLPLLPRTGGAADLLAQDPSGASSRQAVPDPADAWGFEPGTDGRLASWDQIVDFLTRLGRASDRVITEQVGESTEGRPFLLVTISSPENLANRERLREVSSRLADPRGLEDGEIDALVAEGKAVVAVTAGLHSTEVAPPQMTPVLAHRLATADDATSRRILEEVVFLLIPNFNPDGTQKVVEWVRETRGTEWEGAYYPDLYHHYSGHDNNRDAYALNQAESRHFAKIVYRDWVPQLYLDVHQMGSYGPRLYVPPYDDPINPNPDPMVYLEHELVGAAMRVALEREGITGVSAGTYFEGWWLPSFHMATNHHNIAGMLTETASANMAEPLYIHPHQLRGHGREMEVYEQIQRFPHPWEGGWWGLEDMMRQQEVSTYAMLEMASRNRELLLRNMAFKARRSVERGETTPPHAFIVPRDQHDPVAAHLLVGTLMQNGVEVHRADRDFRVDGRAFDAGDFVVRAAQPNRSLVISLLSEQRYPDNEVIRQADGTIMGGTPYDMSQFVLAEHAGVERHGASVPPGEWKTDLELVTDRPWPEGEVTGGGSAGWLTTRRNIEAYHVLNSLLAEGGNIFALEEPVRAGGVGFGPGDLWIPAASADAERIEEFADALGMDFVAADASPPARRRIQEPVIGLYRRYMGGNMDEGWTRYLLDHYDFDYRRVEADGIRAGALEDLNVFVFPHDDLEALEGDGDLPAPGEGTREEYPDAFVPPRYREGLDSAAVERLEEWTRAGGTLVLLGDAWELAAGEMGVPISDATAGLPDTTFYSPGSTLRATFDTAHPLAWGMPEQELVLNWGSPGFRIDRTAFNGRIAAPVRYAERDLLKSGWLIGQEHIAGLPAAVVAAYGRGTVVAIGFRSQFRAQTSGTFPVLFNSLYPLAEEP